MSKRAYQPFNKRVFVDQKTKDENPGAQYYEGLDFSPGGRDSPEADNDTYGIDEAVEHQDTGWDGKLPDNTVLRPPAPDDSWDSGEDKGFAEYPPRGDNSFLRQQAENKRKYGTSQDPRQLAAEKVQASQPKVDVTALPPEITSRKIETPPLDVSPPDAGIDFKGVGFAASRFPGLKQAVMQMLLKANPSEEYAPNNDVDESGINKAAAVGPPAEQAQQQVSEAAPEQASPAEQPKEQGAPNPKGSHPPQSAESEGPDDILAAVTKYLGGQKRPESNGMLPYLKAAQDSFNAAHSNGQHQVRGNVYDGLMADEAQKSKDFDADQGRRSQLVQELVKQKFEGDEKAKDRAFNEKKLAIDDENKDATRQQAALIAKARLDQANQRLEEAKARHEDQAIIAQLQMEQRQAMFDVAQQGLNTRSANSLEQIKQLFGYKSAAQGAKNLPDPNAVQSLEDLDAEIQNTPVGKLAGFGTLHNIAPNNVVGQNIAGALSGEGWGSGEQSVQNRNKYQAGIAAAIHDLYGASVTGLEDKKADTLFGTGWRSDESAFRAAYQNLRQAQRLKAQNAIAGMSPEAIDNLVKGGAKIPQGVKIPQRHPTGPAKAPPAAAPQGPPPPRNTDTPVKKPSANAPIGKTSKPDGEYQMGGKKVKVVGGLVYEAGG